MCGERWRLNTMFYTLPMCGERWRLNTMFYTLPMCGERWRLNTMFYTLPVSSVGLETVVAEKSYKPPIVVEH